MADTVEALWNSTDNFHRRFNVDTTLLSCLRQVGEEFIEFVHAAEESSNLSGEGEKEEELLLNLSEEAADLLVTVIGVLQHAHATRDQFEFALKVVRLKNDGKTLDTHRVNSRGKIERITT
jgi:hypothetical protein